MPELDTNVRGWFGPALEVDADPAVARARREQRQRFLDLHTTPLLRLLGFSVVAGVILFEDLRTGALRWPGSAALPLAILLYCLVSWGVLLRFHRKAGGLDLPLVFLLADYWVALVLIYRFGADESWAFAFLLFRVADQVYTSTGRSLLFAVSGVAAYAGLLVYLSVVEGRTLDLPLQAMKLLLLAVMSGYICLVSGTAERLRARTRRALTMAAESIRELSEQSKQLELARQHAEDASRLKSSFLANMSHEIRTPLNGVIGCTDLLADSSLDPQQLDYLRTIRAAGTRLLSVINDVLEISKIEADKVVLEHAPVDLRALGESVLDLVAPRAHDKGLELIAVLPEQTEELFGDPHRIQQVLTNLLGNAVKFTDAPSRSAGRGAADAPDPAPPGSLELTEAGEIRLRIAIFEERGQPWLRAEVRDTGIGIPEDACRLLFSPFIQADGTTTRRYGGTGLGLAISKALVSLMGGRISVSSVLGVGTTFVMEVPLERGRRLEGTDRRALEGRRVHLIEPNVNVREAARWELERAGAEVAPAAPEHGEAPVETAVVGIGFCGERLDLAEALRARGARVIALVPFGRSEVRARAEAAGLRVVTRPVHRRALLEAIADDGAHHRAVLHGLGRRSARPLRVLAAEDNAVNQHVLRKMLERFGHEHTLVEDGARAVERFEPGRFDIVLMDCQMPVLDGYEATRAIRARELDGTRVPIIAVTANAMNEEEARCRAAGMDDYLTKPVRAEQLRAVLERWASADRCLVPRGDGSSAARDAPPTGAARDQPR